MKASLSFTLKTQIKMKKNWKTTLAGFATAVGLTLKATSTNPIMQWVGDGLSILGALFLGKTAQDSASTK